MVAINIKKSMHNMDCDAGVYSRDIMNMLVFFVSQVFGLVKSFKDQYLQRLIKVINVKTLHDASIH